jgi:hypothetical protein
MKILSDIAGRVPAAAHAVLDDLTIGPTLEIRG